MSRRLLTSVALVGALVGLTACGSAAEDGTTEENQGAGASASQSAPQDATQGGAPAEGGDQQGAQNGSAAPEAGQSPEMPEPDTEGIPEVVATVNDEEISGEEFTGVYESQFQQMSMQAQMSGQELDQDQLKQQTLDGMIGAELIVQDAQADGHEATDEEVQTLLDETAQMQGAGSGDELLSTFEEQGIPEEQVRSDLQKQVLMNKAIEDLDVPEPTDEELRELYDSAMAQQPQGQGSAAPGDGASEGGGEGGQPETPSFEELKPQLEQQVTAQKQGEAVQGHMDSLREDAEVQTNL